MKRTQVYLPEELHEAVRRLAFEQRRSMADLVREAVSAYVEAVAPENNGQARPVAGLDAPALLEEMED